MASSITLILGGARSGKSDYAQQLAVASGRAVVFVATATPSATEDDPEMAERIAAHRRARPAQWQTVEETIELVHAIVQHAQPDDVVVIDCLTLWVSNVCLAELDEEAEADGASLEHWRLLEAALTTQTAALLHVARSKQIDVILISNEVGLGVVPAFPLGRHYRDLLGRVNQAVAREADSVILMVAGLPINLRRLALTHSPLDRDKDVL
ncbi:MAG TPA: bifunctional adenosylcobinamide kinase/adenosylcobinamide-phosphate guanylyltransferase [Chloroflexota bacterium]|nr:bifunctional adenosylcobinamide kinase/adenosylcobinamide-phosphate guanylyltransferase [Chloroflexota bacterium]